MSGKETAALVPRNAGSRSAAALPVGASARARRAPTGESQDLTAGQHLLTQHLQQRT